MSLLPFIHPKTVYRTSGDSGYVYLFTILNLSQKAEFFPAESRDRTSRIRQLIDQALPEF
jgi:hypothetical protein